MIWNFYVCVELLSSNLPSQQTQSSCRVHISYLCHFLCQRLLIELCIFSILLWSTSILNIKFPIGPVSPSFLFSLVTDVSAASASSREILDNEWTFLYSFKLRTHHCPRNKSSRTERGRPQLRFEWHLCVHKLFLNIWGVRNHSRQC